jgi:putative SOS response-associated peptidase YedK
MCNHYRDHEAIFDYIRKALPWVKIPAKLPVIRGHMYPKYPGPVLVQENGEANLVEMRWGVWPFYQKEKPTLLTNARNDGLLKKPTWKQSARQRRCLIPATGYFEPGLGPPGAKGEVLFTVKEQTPFCFAGLWDRDPDESGNRGYTIVTTEPNEYARRFHDRMPVVLRDDQLRDWIGEEPLPDDRLMALCQGLAQEALTHEEIAARPREKLTIKRPKKDSGETGQASLL